VDSLKPVQGASQPKSIRIGIAVSVFVLLGVLIFAIAIGSKSASPEATLVWLEPIQFAGQMQTNRFARVYYKALNFAAPVLRHFQRPKTQILIASKFLAAHDVSMSQLGIGASNGTNQTGVQAWILSPVELEQIEKQMKRMKGLEVVNAPRITLTDGTTASVCCGQTDPKSLQFIGVTVDVAPRIASHQFVVPMSAIYTELNGAIQTNLYAACRVVVPNAGGILISSPESKDTNGTNYWIILSPTAIDASGKMIRL